MVDIGIGRIDIFLRHTLRARIEQTTAECRHLAAHTNPREDDATAKTVEILTIVALAAQARLQQKLFLETFTERLFCHCIALVQTESQTETLDDIVAETARTEILQTDGTAVFMLVQNPLEVFCRPFIHDEHRLALVLLPTLLVGHLALLYLYVILISQPPQCLDIGHLLMFHDEVDRIASLPAGETLIDTARGRHGERGRRVVMERTQTFIARAPLAQRHKLRHHIHDVRGVHNSIYRSPVYSHHT